MSMLESYLETFSEEPLKVIRRKQGSNATFRVGHSIDAQMIHPIRIACLATGMNGGLKAHSARWRFGRGRFNFKAWVERAKQAKRRNGSEILWDCP